jgi:hypothetical protein
MMPTLRFSVLVWLAGCGLMARGQWDGFPVEDNQSWYPLETHSYISQLYSAAVERCHVSGVATPKHVATNNVFAGFAAGTVATNPVTLVVVTNPVLTSRAIITTNQFGPFEYAYTNYDGGIYTATCYPGLDRRAFDTLDAAINLLYSHFVVTNITSNGTFSLYFKTEPKTNVFPMMTRSALFHYQDIGLAQAFATNPVGVVTGATGWFTRWTPPEANLWPLASVTWGTNGWVFKRMTDLDTRDYSTNLPAVFYRSAGAAEGLSVSLALTGTCLRVSDQVSTNARETISVSDAGGQLANKWASITSCGVSGSPPNTGDVLLVAYPVSPTLYGDVPGRLLAIHLNERWKAINALVATVTPLQCQMTEIYWGECPTFITNWSQAVGIAQADFKQRSISENPTVHMYGGIGSYGESFTALGLTKYRVVIQAAKWKVIGWTDQTNLYASTKQTYMTMRRSAYTYGGYAGNQVWADNAFVSYWPNQPADVDLLINQYSLMDVQTVEQATNYVPVVYGTASGIPVVEQPANPVNDTARYANGGRVSDYYPPYSDTNLPCIANLAIGVNFWNVEGGFKYRD